VPWVARVGRCKHTLPCAGLHTVTRTGTRHDTRRAAATHDTRHAHVVEVLICNGASPLVLDNARHNSALHWAAASCRAECVARLLGSGAMFQMQAGQLVAIAGVSRACVCCARACVLLCASHARVCLPW
jgi:hypothetical protein